MNDLMLRPLTAWLDTVSALDWACLLNSLPPQSVDMVLTDMPYGITACVWDTVIDLDLWWKLAHRVAKPRAAIVCTASQPFTSRLVISNLEQFKYALVWKKPNGTNFLNAPFQPLKTHEDIIIFSRFPASYSPIGKMNYYPQITKDNPYYKWNPVKSGSYIFHSNPDYEAVNNTGTRYPNSIIEIKQERGYNPTQKPVALFEYLIRTYTRPGDIVLDPFCGSGTTALAARNTGRRYICGDLSAEYVQIARDRLAQPYTLPLFPEPSETRQDATQLSLL